MMALLLRVKYGSESWTDLMTDNIEDDYLALFQSEADCAEDAPAWPIRRWTAVIYKLLILVFKDMSIWVHWRLPSKMVLTLKTKNTFQYFLTSFFWNDIHPHSHSCGLWTVVVFLCQGDSIHFYFIRLIVVIMRPNTLIHIHTMPTVY